jgi:hypothetical protein
MFKQLKREAGVNTTQRPFQIVPMSEEIFPVAENILFQHARTFQIGSIDALHLAIVKRLSIHSSVTMVTSDQSMQKVCERLSIPVYDPENEEI